jgi:hypothetical protein
MTRFLAAVALLSLAAALARGGAMAPPPSVALRVAAGDAVVVGTVTAITDKAEKAELVKDDGRVMKVATVKVESAVMGKVAGTIKVGTISYPRGGRMPVAQLTKGQEALLVLTKHPTKKGVFVLANDYDVVANKNYPNFKKEIAEAKRVVAALTSPQSSLKAKKADERLFAAAVLLTRYKSPAPGSTKTEAVPAAESKLILNTLAEADWGARRGRDYYLSPQNLFYQFGLTAKDGWAAPMDFTQYAPLAKKWLKDNAGKFKMTRYVRDKATVEPSEEP